MTLKLKRSPLFFELNIILPALLLSLMLIPMFILPADSGEKVSLGKVPLISRVNYTYIWDIIYSNGLLNPITKYLIPNLINQINWCKFCKVAKYFKTIKIYHFFIIREGINDYSFRCYKTLTFNY